MYGVDDGPIAVDVEASPDWIDVEALSVLAPRPRKPVRMGVASPVGSDSP